MVGTSLLNKGERSINRMASLRRILTGTALFVAACGMASADSISYGFDPVTGNFTVTQTAYVTGVLNVNTPTSLFTFGSFASLGLTGDTYVAGDSTFDYQLTNTVTAFSITNNDVNSDTVNASVVSTIGVDPGTTMSNTISTGVYNGDAKTVAEDLGIGFTGNTAGDKVFNAAGVSGQVIAGGGGNYTFPGLPVVTTLGISYFDCGSGNFGVIDCSQSIGNTEAASGFSFGTTDNQAYQESLVGSGNLNLTINATTDYAAIAEVTYEFTGNAPAPEPATYALLGSALIGLGLLRKRLTGK